MKIMIDFDNTLCNFHELFTTVFVEMFPDREIPRYTQLTTYNLEEAYDISDELIGVLFTQIRQKNRYKSAAPMDATFFIWIKKLINEGHELFIATKNPPEMEELIQYWLGKYGIYDLPIIFVENMEEKLDLDFDVMIDDSPEFPNHKYWEENPDKYLLVYDAPFNYQIRLLPGNNWRVYNWKDVYQAIVSIQALNTNQGDVYI